MYSKTFYGAHSIRKSLRAVSWSWNRKPSTWRQCVGWKEESISSWPYDVWNSVFTCSSSRLRSCCTHHGTDSVTSCEVKRAAGDMSLCADVAVNKSRNSSQSRVQFHRHTHAYSDGFTLSGIQSTSVFTITNAQTRRGFTNRPISLFCLLHTPCAAAVAQ